MGCISGLPAKTGKEFFMAEKNGLQQPTSTPPDEPGQPASTTRHPEASGQRLQEAASAIPPPSAAVHRDPVEKALLARPGISVRARLTLGFLLFFLVSTGVTLSAWFTLNRLEQKMAFLEIADRYTTEIQQARRFEKNYFLYGTNLQDVIEHVQIASRLLSSGKGELESVIGERKFRLVEGHLVKYIQLLERLQALDSHSDTPPLPKHPAIEAALREHGAAMVSQSLELAEEERKAVQLMLKLFKRLPLVFLAILLPLIFYTANFLARQILTPLSRLLGITERIAHGDFTPIPPARRFRDEFTNLSIALNHMMTELGHRHDMLVKSHKLRAVGTLTAGIAHELNNPINNVMLTAAILEEDYNELSDEERLEMIYDLTTQADRATRIVRNLLDFARESELESELVDVGRLLEETLQLTSNELKLKKVKVEFLPPPNLPPIYGDKPSLSQIFVNLVLNALDAMPGGGLLEIRVGEAAEPGFLSVEVRDSGTGIPEHILPNIFDPFFSTKRRSKGTGLGLSVSLGIVKKHGGNIRVQSQPGKGTTFTVLLPITAVPAAIRKEGSAPKASGA